MHLLNLPCDLSFGYALPGVPKLTSCRLFSPLNFDDWTSHETVCKENVSIHSRVQDGLNDDTTLHMTSICPSCFDRRPRRDSVSLILKLHILLVRAWCPAWDADETCRPHIHGVPYGVLNAKEGTTSPAAKRRQWEQSR